MKEDVSDFDLILKIKSGDSIAEKSFYQRYSIYSYKVASDYYKMNHASGITFKEFYSVALASIFLALKDFDLNRNKFYPYWLSISKKQIMNYIRENSYLFGGRMFSGISLNDLVNENSNTKLEETVTDLSLCEDDNRNFSDVKKSLIENFNADFTDEEFLIMEKLYIGKTNQEIANDLGCTIDHIYYLRKSIKEKLTKVIETGYFI